jgi:hypothetical protein
LPLPSTFDQEFNLRRRQWNTQVEKPKYLSDTLTDSRVCTLMYPNITKILHLLLLTSVTSSTVEIANSSLRFIKNSFRSTMGEDRFNALILIYIHKDIEIDFRKLWKCMQDNIQGGCYCLIHFPSDLFEMILRQ